MKGFICILLRAYVVVQVLMPWPLIFYSMFMIKSQFIASCIIVLQSTYLHKKVEPN